MENETESYFQKFFELVCHIQVTDRHGLRVSLEEGTTRAIHMITSLGNTSNKAILIGNGGSAAIASHVQNDLCKTVGVRAMVFNEPPLLTALINDTSYELVFESLVELWGDPNDLLIAVSSSGCSENILLAAQKALKKQCQILTFSGFRAENPLRSLGDLNFYVPSESYGVVEISHMMLLHSLTDRAAASRLTGKISA